MITITPHHKRICCDAETPVSLYSKLAKQQKYAFLLESAETSTSSGRYSFIGFDPMFLHVSPAGCTENPIEVLRQKYGEFCYAECPNLPKFQAPFVGYFAYETARHFEKLNLPTAGAQIPEAIFFLPKNLLIFDHKEHYLTLIAYSKKYLDNLVNLVESVRHSESPGTITFGDEQPAPKNGNDEKQFESLVKNAKERICEGEIFQVVLCRKFTQKTEAKPLDLYRKLRLISPSPYMYYLQYPDFSIIGSSPETLVKTERNNIVLRPIAGTRRRGKTREEDIFFEKELKNDAKEQAEHMMLVDLGRNDVGRVAKPGSVKVTKLMEVEKYSHVMHLVSEIRGECSEKSDIFDVFASAFPAGTLTGAPKIRAMEIIAELEKEPRGIYGGAVGYFDLSGNMDFAIAIRTMLYQNGEITLRAGAGIVYDSSAAAENRECLNKARAPLTALIQ